MSESLENPNQLAQGEVSPHQDSQPVTENNGEGQRDGDSHEVVPPSEGIAADQTTVKESDVVAPESVSDSQPAVGAVEQEQQEAPQADSQVNEESLPETESANAEIGSSLLHEEDEQKKRDSELKRDKYVKLLDLYKKEIAKRDAVQAKVQELEQLKSKLQASQHPEGLSSKQNQLYELKKIILDEKSSGQTKAKDLLKSIFQLDLQVNNSQQAQPSQQLNLLNQLKVKLEGLLEEKKGLMTQLEELKQKVDNSNQKLSVVDDDSKNKIAEAEKQKQQLTAQIAKDKQEINNIQKQVNSKNSKLSQQAEQVNTLQDKLKQAQQMLKTLKNLKVDGQQNLKEIESQIVIKTALIEKGRQAIIETQNKIESDDHKIQKLEKEEREKRAKMDKIRLDEQKSDPIENVEARKLNSKLKEEIEKIKREYLEEQEKSKDLVPQASIDRANEEMEELKKEYEKNKRLPEKIKEAEKDIEALKEKKERLEWGHNPEIKQLDAGIKRELEEKAKLEQFFKNFSKDEELVFKSLEEYKNQFPEFELELQRVKNKKQSSKKEEKKVEQPSTVAKKKKKGKNVEQEEEPKIADLPAAKVQSPPPKVEAQVVAAKTEAPVEQQKPSEGQADKKKKKKKNK